MKFHWVGGGKFTDSYGRVEYLSACGRDVEISSESFRSVTPRQAYDREFSCGNCLRLMELDWGVSAEEACKAHERQMALVRVMESKGLRAAMELLPAA